MFHLTEYCLLLNRNIIKKSYLIKILQPLVAALLLPIFKKYAIALQKYNVTSYTGNDNQEQVYQHFDDTFSSGSVLHNEIRQPMSAGRSLQVLPEGAQGYGKQRRQEDMALQQGHHPRLSRHRHHSQQPYYSY